MLDDVHGSFVFLYVVLCLLFVPAVLHHCLDVDSYVALCLQFVPAVLRQCLDVDRYVALCLLFVPAVLRSCLDVDLYITLYEPLYLPVHGRLSYGFYQLP